MNLRQQIEEDLRLATLSKKVICLEGKTDVDIFFSLLGVSVPADGQHQGVLVRGLKADKASGSTAVKSLLNVVVKTPYKGVFGIVDGDGQNYQDLEKSFDAPYTGPLFSWKAYCIENLLAKTGCPKNWGISFDWEVDLQKYGLYVALNRMHKELQSTLRAFGLARMPYPIRNEPLKTIGEVLTALEEAKHLLENYDVAQRFQDEVALFESTLRGSLDEAHAFLNGKWIIEHLAPTLTNRQIEECRSDWITHAIAVGGLAEVRDWWERLTGSPP